MTSHATDAPIRRALEERRAAVRVGVFTQRLSLHLTESGELDGALQVLEEPRLPAVDRGRGGLSWAVPARATSRFEMIRHRDANSGVDNSVRIPKWWRFTPAPR